MIRFIKAGLAMLVAQLGNDKIYASLADRGPEYNCPKCKGELILKKGRKVIDHFAHKPPTDCAWAKGETLAHLGAKKVVATALAARGLKVEVESIVNTLPGDRRADVMVWGPKGRRVAFELQHTTIDLNEIEQRASSYAKASIAQIWIPFLPASIWEKGEQIKGGLFVQRYSPRMFEKWVHGFNGKLGMWMYDQADKKFWLGRLASHRYYVEETSWFSEGGQENYGGGYNRFSKRYKELYLEGPYAAENLLIKIEARKAYATEHYSWPAGLIARLIPSKNET